MEKYGIVVLFIITVVTITGYLLFKNKSRLSDFHKKLSLTAALALIIIYSKMIIQNWEYMKIFKKLQILNVVFLVLGGISLFYSKNSIPFFYLLSLNF